VIAAHPFTRRVLALLFVIPLCSKAVPVRAQESPSKQNLSRQDVSKQDVPAAAPSPASAAAQPSASASAAQVPADIDTRTQFPAFLDNSFFGMHVAYINYNFTDRQLEPGFRSGSLARPKLGARVDLFGHRFNEFLSLQTVYMRPGAYVTYRDINGDSQPHHVWMNFGAVTMQGQAPVNRRLSVYGEAGFGIVSRRGFDSKGVPVIRHAHYGAPVLGGGLIYHANTSWDLLAGVTYIPQRAEDKQPATAFVTTGFRYNVRALPAERVEAVRRDGYLFPENVVQLEFGTGGGYSVNKFFSSKLPVFWGGNVPIDRGLALHYNRNVFHTNKIFALDLGTSVSFWRSRELHDGFATLSVYPLLRFTFLRTEPADVYFMYSLAGPTYISKVIIDGLGTGSHFTFQDFMGIGAFTGKSRNMSIGLKISHYSNGNLAVDNAGLKIPVTVTLGYAF
jgi:opacity protein-like surface antigen